MKKFKFHYAWVILVACCLIQFFTMGIMATAGLYFTSLMEEFSVNRTAVSMMVTVQMIALTISLPFAGRMIYRHNIKLLAAAAAVLYSVALVAASFAGSMFVLYGAWFVVGMAMPFVTGLLVNTLLGNWFTKKLGMVIGIAASIGGVGGAVMNPLLGGIIATYGWRTGYLMSGILMLVVVAPISFLLLRKRPSGDDNDKRAGHPYGYGEHVEVSARRGGEVSIEFMDAVKKPYFYMLIVAQVCVAIIVGGYSHIPSHVVGIGFAITFSAFVQSVTMIGDATGKIALGVLLDRFKPNVIMLLYMLFGFGGLLGLTVFRSQALILASGFVLGLSNALFQVGIPFYIRSVFGSKDFSQISAIVGTCGTVGTVISSVTVGAMFDAFGSYTIPFTVLSALFLIGIPCVVVARSMRKKDKTVVVDEIEDKTIVEATNG